MNNGVIFYATILWIFGFDLPVFPDDVAVSIGSETFIIDAEKGYCPLDANKSKVDGGYLRGTQLAKF